MASNDGNVLFDGENELNHGFAGDGDATMASESEGKEVNDPMVDQNAAMVDDGVTETSDLDLGGGVTDDTGVEAADDEEGEEAPDGTDHTDGGGV